ncbi:hypothetical protein [Streptomyces sp. NPDC059262]|uniref:hypothetical protein n=1 Tax=Streptomyces sp. NPDC059262 TaxID=3346797 RepID=UPI0036B1C931
MPPRRPARTRSRAEPESCGRSTVVAFDPAPDARVATRLIRGDRAVTGVVALGEAFDAGSFLRALTLDHLTRLGLPAGAS